jgi:hypothetical protein
MPTKLRYGTALLALVCVAHLPATRSAMAVTAELARKCGLLTDKAYPLLWVPALNEGAVYSPDGFTIQFNRASVWVLTDPQPLPGSARY